MNSIGEKIRQLRVSKGMTQGELADALGYTHKSSINKIEKEENEISISKLKKVSVFFNIPIGFFLSDNLLAIDSIALFERLRMI